MFSENRVACHKFPSVAKQFQSLTYRCLLMNRISLKRGIRYLWIPNVMDILDVSPISDPQNACCCLKLRATDICHTNSNSTPFLSNKNTLRKIWAKFSGQDSRFGNRGLLGNWGSCDRHCRITQIRRFTHRSHVCRPVVEDNAARGRQQVLGTCNLKKGKIHRHVL